jgi:hypothetical protein
LAHKLDQFGVAGLALAETVLVLSEEFFKGAAALLG